MTLYDKILKKEAKISLVGLGYVGLPIALAFARKTAVVGFDIKPERIALMKDKIDPSQELETEAFDDCDILFTADAEDLRKADSILWPFQRPSTTATCPTLGHSSLPRVP